MFTNSLRRKLLASTVMAGSILASTAALAQAAPATSSASADATDNKDTIIVTGTLIRNPNLTSSSPVSSVSENEITLRAPNNAEEILRNIPGISPGIGTQVNNGSNGTNSVDLRGLGTQRNLVLLDGNRIVPTLSNGTVDLNVIPIALLQRVDVLTGGASTTYGADAVSGVVNFITRRDFSGVDLRTSYKLTEQGDGQAFRADLTLGANFADDRGNAVLSLGYTDVKPVYVTRPFGLFGVSSTSGRASGASPTSVPTTIAFDDGSTLQLNSASTSLIPAYQAFNFNPYNIFQTPLRRKSAYAAVNYQISDTIEAYGRALFANNEINSIIAPSGLFGNTLTIPANNPYLNTTIRDQICTAESIPLGPTCNTNPALPLPGVYRRLVELGPRIGNYQNNVYDARVGVRANITSTIKLDVNASYGRSEQTQTNSGYVLNSRVQQALNATSATTCTVTTGGCVPLNIFGPGGSITPAQVAFLQGSSQVRINTELSQVRALLSGDLGFSVPSASVPVSFAVGAEYRKYDYERLPDARAQSPGELGGAGGAVLPFTGGYNVKEVYGELIAPIVADKPFFKELTLEAGVRYSSYKIKDPSNPSFSTTTYKGGVTWQPVDGLRLRGNYQHAVRAPNIGELFGPVTTGLTNLTVDPCAGTAPVGNATLTAVCVAQGAPAARIGTIPNPAAGQANATGGGNINLTPEIADTFTIGAVLTPHDFIPNLSLSIDYYDIKINKAITAPTPGDAIAACFNNLSTTSVACTSIRRNGVNGGLSGPTATVFGLPLTLSNVGRLATDGIDVTADWKHDIGEAKLNLNFSGNWTRHLRFQSGGNSVNRDCVGYYSVNCGPSLGQIQPEFSFLQRTTVGVGGASISLLWRYIAPVKYEGQATDFVARGYTAANQNLFSGIVTNSGPVNSALAGQSFNFNKIRAYHYFDLTAQFEVMKNFQFTIGAQNLFNVSPPIVGGQAGSTVANYGNTFPSTYDTLGRSFSASVRVHF
jgi:iron complex outermembrane receptor protein